MNEHGKLDEERYLRWCDACGHHHGPLYPCEHYSTELLLSIEHETLEVQKNLSDPVWCKAQIENGLPPEGIFIFRLFAGLE